MRHELENVTRILHSTFNSFFDERNDEPGPWSQTVMMDDGVHQIEEIRYNKDRHRMENIVK